MAMPETDTSAKFKSLSPRAALRRAHLFETAVKLTLLEKRPFSPDQLIARVSERFGEPVSANAVGRLVKRLNEERLKQDRRLKTRGDQRRGNTSRFRVS